MKWINDLLEWFDSLGGLANFIEVAAAVLTTGAVVYK